MGLRNIVRGKGFFLGLLLSPAMAWSAHGGIYFHPINTFGALIGGQQWLVVTGEIPLRPHTTLIVTPTFARNEGVSEGEGWFGGAYRTEHENSHLGIYAGPRLYLHSEGYFYAQALLSHHHIEKREKGDWGDSDADFKALGGFVYLGFKIPGKHVSFSADAGLGRKFMEYDSRRTGSDLGSFPYWDGTSIDINICLGFNIRPRI